MNPPVVWSSQRLKPAPEETVVHQEQIRFLIDGAPNGALTQVDGSCDLDDIALGLNLHAVDGLCVVWKTISAQQ
jgi:hypothetical protein